MCIDVLLLQLGTPDAPTAAALRPYLRAFLSDPRVIEGSAFGRWLLVNLLIVPFRSPRSAEKYKRIWDANTGSPLLSITAKQTAALERTLGPGFRVRFAMSYGSPSVGSVIRELCSSGSRRLVLIPMFPQYSAATSASSFDAVFSAMRSERAWPALRTILEFHDDAGYIKAVAATIRRKLDEAQSQGLPPPEKRLLSFHGIPKEYAGKGDPYPEQAETTARLVAAELGWSRSDWLLTFQSRFGKQEWLGPYTDMTLKKLAREGVKRVLVATPGFTTDCLETIDEIGYEAVEDFRHAGGETLIRVPCVNDSPEFIAALAKRIEREIEGWA